MLHYAPALFPKEHAIVAPQQHAIPREFQEADHGTQTQIGPGIGAAGKTPESGKGLCPEVVAVGSDPEAAAAIPDCAFDGIAAEQIAGIQNLMGAIGFRQV